MFNIVLGFAHFRVVGVNLEDFNTLGNSSPMASLNHAKH